MSSLVSEFLINPVLRQARRFSSGFATEDAGASPTVLQRQPQPQNQRPRTRSLGASSLGAEDVIAEVDEDRRMATVYTSSHTSPTGASPTRVTRVPASPTLSGRQSPSNQTTSYDHHDLRSIYATVLLQTSEPNGETSQSGAATSSSPPNGNAPPSPLNKVLPEDDGMGVLRRKIHAIQEMDIPPDLKAQLMHQILGEGYLKSSPQGRVSSPLPPSSPKSITSVPESPEPTGALQQALKFWNPLGDSAGPLSLPLTEDDLRPTYVPQPPKTTNGGVIDVDPSTAYDIAERIGRRGSEEEGEEPAFGCEHYRRNVKLQCFTCEKWYTCRFCHDAAEDHTLPRKETKHMLCMFCGCAQRASDTCVRCNRTAGYYYCGICKLWNDDPNKPIYHCNDCGLCRVGQGLGKDFFHCKKCMACISMTGEHKCIERSIDCDCPICGDYMFSSPKPVVFMQCGHSIHKHCFQDHMRTSYKCPICNKSCINMEYQFRNIDLAIIHQPMPPEYRDARAVISCNDCSAKSQTAYHWLGLKCSICHSYNTVQLQLLHMPSNADEARRAARQAAGSVSGGSVPDLSSSADLGSAAGVPRLGGEELRQLFQRQRFHDIMSIGAAASSPAIGDNRPFLSRSITSPDQRQHDPHIGTSSLLGPPISAASVNITATDIPLLVSSGHQISSPPRTRTSSTSDAVPDISLASAAGSSAPIAGYTAMSTAITNGNIAPGHSNLSTEGNASTSAIASLQPPPPTEATSRVGLENIEHGYDLGDDYDDDDGDITDDDDHNLFDFWGRDEPPAANVTSGGEVDDDEEEDSCDDESEEEVVEEEDEEEEDIVLFGHR